ncbi:MAG: phosphoenolpyruvate carboxylase, partial [Thalassolituus sp.]
MQELDALLRDKVRMLGNALGETIQAHLGDSTLELIEKIRKQAKRARSGDEGERDKLLAMLKDLSDESLVPVVRGFNQFLNLANIAEQQHGISWRRTVLDESNPDEMFADLIVRLDEAGVSGQALTDKVANANIELVLTAHPTEITRRTLIQKYDQVSRLLQRRDDLRDGHPEISAIEGNISRLIDEIWHTDEIRQVRPTAVDEAKWG